MLQLLGVASTPNVTCLVCSSQVLNTCLVLGSVTPGLHGSLNDGTGK